MEPSTSSSNPEVTHTLSEDQRATLERLVQDYGLKTVAEHIGISTHAVTKATESPGHELKPKKYDAIVQYLASLQR